MSTDNAGQTTGVLALRFAFRELRGGVRGFYIFIACIALGVMAIAGRVRPVCFWVAMQPSRCFNAKPRRTNCSSCNDKAQSALSLPRAAWRARRMASLH
jgi:hypothetical protein